MISPLASVTLFHAGPAPISQAVVTTWATMAVLIGGAILVSRTLKFAPSKTQALFELIVHTVDSEIRNTMQAEPGPYRAFIGTIFAFIFVANWSTLIPGVSPPTARLETDAALAVLVFLAVIWFGIRSGGVFGYLSTFASPSPLMIPLNLVESVTRAFSMFVRLAGRLDGDAVQACFQQWMIDEIGKLPPSARAAAAGTEMRLDLASAVALDAAAQKRCTKVIADALGGEPQIVFTTDAALIAGFELRGEHLIVGSSWRTDLATIQADLTRDHRAWPRAQNS